MHASTCRWTCTCTCGFCQTVQHLLQKSLFLKPTSATQLAGSPLQLLFRPSCHEALWLPWKHRGMQGDAPGWLQTLQHGFPGQQWAEHCYANANYLYHMCAVGLTPSKNTGLNACTLDRYFPCDKEFWFVLSISHQLCCSGSLCDICGRTEAFMLGCFAHHNRTVLRIYMYHRLTQQHISFYLLFL